MPRPMLDGALDYLGAKRQYDICRFVDKERLDSAMLCVCVGLKCLNHVQKIGLAKMGGPCLADSPIKKWERKIMDYYESPDAAMPDISRMSLECCGHIKNEEQLSRIIGDLSESRQRKIRKWISSQRIEACGIAGVFGIEMMHEEFGLGEDVRMPRVVRQWHTDLKDIYEDRETQEPLLSKWLDDIGLCHEPGKMISMWRGEDDKPMKRKTAERMMEKVGQSEQAG